MKRSHDELDRRVEIARGLLHERRAVIEPDAGFAARVLERLREPDTWTFAWAARRVLPATLALAAALSVAIVATNGLPGRPGPAPGASETQRASDPLDWLLDVGGERR